MYPSLVIVLIAAMAGFQWHMWRRGRKLEQALRLEQSRLQEELRLQKDRLAEELSKRQILFDRMVEGVVLLDASGKVEFGNLALKRLLGLTEEIRGRSLTEAV